MIKALAHYVLSVLLALDQLANAIGGGFPDETISYRASIANQEGSRWACMFCRLIEIIVPDHCDLEKPPKSYRLSRGATWSPPQ